MLFEPVLHDLFAEEIRSAFPDWDGNVNHLNLMLPVVTLVDYILPSVCAKRFKCSGWGVFGCFAGSIVGLFFLPLGIILGPFLGTIAGELIAGKNMAASVRGGFGALLGFVLCLGLKLAAVGLYAWWYFARLPYSS